MPSLGDLHCFIELTGSHKKLQEFGTSYADRTVETFVAVPSKPQSFKVRLKSSKFIAPGISMHVFIDGVYQCNRNRQGLKQRVPPDRQSLVDFCVRQKEEKQKDGSMLARGWEFGELDLVSANNAPGKCSPDVEDNIGCIEVVVLRCLGTRAEAAAKEKGPKMMQLDGTNDDDNISSSPLHDMHKGSLSSEDDFSNIVQIDGAYEEPDHSFGLDGHRKHHYDDRTWRQLRSTQPPSGNYTVPAPPITRFPTFSPHPSVQPSIWGQGPTLSAAGSRVGRTTGFQYGSGPIPHRTRAAAPSALNGAAWNQNYAPLGPDHIDYILATMGTGSEAHASPSAGGWTVNATQGSHHFPGAWPASPYADSISVHSGNTARFSGQDSWDRPAPSIESNQWDASSFTAPYAVPNPPVRDTRSVASSSDSTGTWDSSIRSTQHRQAQPLASGTGNWGEFTLPPSSPAEWSVQSSRRYGWGADNAKASEISHSTVKPSSSASAFAPGTSTTHPSTRAHRSTSVFAPPPPPPPPTVTAPPSLSLHLPNIPTFGPEFETPKTAKNSSDGDCARRAYAEYMAAKAKETRIAESVISEKLWTGDIATGAIGTNIWGAGAQTKNVENHWPNAHTTTNTRPNGGWGSTERRMNTREGEHDISEFAQRDSDWYTTEDMKRSGKGWHDTPKSDVVADRSMNWASLKIPSSRSNGRNTPTNSKSIPNVRTAPKGAKGKDNGWDLSKSMREALTGFIPPRKNSKAQPEDTRDANGWSVAAPNSPQPSSPPTWDTTTPSKPHDETLTWSLNTWPDEPASPPSSPEKPKSRLTHYHQHKHRHPSPPTSTPKRHWQFPPPTSTTPLVTDHSITIPALPPHPINLARAQQKGIQHQVRIGPGVRYTHAVGRPEYIDGFEKPYAVFRFKYRSADYLRSVLGMGVDVDVGVGGAETGKEGGERKGGKEGRTGLERFSREALVGSALERHTKMEEKRYEEGRGWGASGTAVWVESVEGAGSEGKKHREERNKGKRGKEEGGAWGVRGWGVSPQSKGQHLELPRR